MSYPSVDFQYPYYQPIVVPSAPPLDQPQQSFYTPYVVVPVDHSAQERAAQAYLTIWADLNEIHPLEFLTLDVKTIQTLKQMEENAKHGIVSSLLGLVSRIFNFLGNVAFAFAIGNLTISALAFLGGLPVVAGLFACFAGGCLLARFVCNVASKVADYLQEKRIESTLRASTEDSHFPLSTFKAWIKKGNLQGIEQRLRLAMQDMVVAQQTVGYLAPRAQQIDYVQLQLNKIQQYKLVEGALQKANPSPLLIHYLAES